VHEHETHVPNLDTGPQNTKELWEAGICPFTQQTVGERTARERERERENMMERDRGKEEEDRDCCLKVRKKDKSCGMGGRKLDGEGRYQTG
jgi:hypothetical protein